MSNKTFHIVHELSLITLKGKIKSLFVIYKISEVYDKWEMAEKQYTDQVTTNCAFSYHMPRTFVHWLTFLYTFCAHVQKCITRIFLPYKEGKLQLICQGHFTNAQGV